MGIEFGSSHRNLYSSTFESFGSKPDFFNRISFASLVIFHKKEKKEKRGLFGLQSSSNFSWVLLVQVGVVILYV